MLRSALRSQISPPPCAPRPCHQLSALVSLSQSSISRAQLPAMNGFGLIFVAHLISLVVLHMATHSNNSACIFQLWTPLNLLVLITSLETLPLIGWPKLCLQYPARSVSPCVNNKPTGKHSRLFCCCCFVCVCVWKWEICEPVDRILTAQALLCVLCICWDVTPSFWHLDKIFYSEKMQKHFSPTLSREQKVWNSVYTCSQGALMNP